jgi:hypothetical protein
MLKNRKRDWQVNWQNRRPIVRSVNRIKTTPFFIEAQITVYIAVSGITTMEKD